jgi:hypothetical protein
LRATASVGESKEWATIISKAEENRELLQGSLGKNTIQRTVRHIYREAKRTEKCPEGQHSEQTKQGDGFKKVHSRKPHNTKEAASTSKKEAQPRASVEVATRNFFTPIRTTNMDTDAPGTESNASEETVPGNSGRPPQVLLKSATNLIQLQKQLKGMTKQIFEFHSTRYGTRVITRHGELSINESPLRDQQPFLLYLPPKFTETHQGSDPPPASKHPCGGHTQWAGGPWF